MNAGENTKERLVRIAAGPSSLHNAEGPIVLEGTLSLPAKARGIVAFAHGSGSSRHSPRNRHVAHLLQEAGFATLLFDLLSVDEETEDALTGLLRFDIDLLTRRLISATDWLAAGPDTRSLPLGYFGASTGAGAALVAAAERPDLVRAVVSRGGRPDLAGSALERVQAPTLLIVGGNDQSVIVLNREALGRMVAPRRLETVPGATHLFEEPGTLDRVAEQAREWFARYLIPTGTRAVGPGRAVAPVTIRP